MLGPVLTLEPLDHRIPAFLRDLAAQKKDFLPELILKILPQERSHCRELRKNQSSIADRENLLQHFGQSGQLTGSSGKGGPVSQKLGRVVADLFELGEYGQDQAFPLDSLCGVQGTFHIFHDRCIQRSLFFGQVAEDFHFHLFGQIRDDGSVRL
jgi:hypothetical protein